MQAHLPYTLLGRQNLAPDRAYKRYLQRVGQGGQEECPGKLCQLIELEDEAIRHCGERATKNCRIHLALVAETAGTSSRRLISSDEVESGKDAAACFGQIRG